MLCGEGAVIYSNVLMHVSLYTHFFSFLLGEYKKDEFLEAARSGREEVLLAYVTPIIVNCHASDGRKSTALHLAAGYNRVNCVQLLLQHGADVHAKDKGYVVHLAQYTITSRLFAVMCNVLGRTLLQPRFLFLVYQHLTCTHLSLRLLLRHPRQNPSLHSQGQW